MAKTDPCRCGMKTMRTILVVLGCCCALAPVLIRAPGASDWPMFCRDLAHNAKTSDAGPDTDALRWFHSVRPTGWGDGPVIRSSPVFSDGALFVAALSGSLWCFDVEKEDTRWVADVGTPLSSTPAVSNGLIYVLGGADDRRLHAYYTADGSGAWTSVPLGEANSWSEVGYWDRSYWMESSPAVVGDSVAFVGAPNGYLYAIYSSVSDTANVVGTIKWSAHLGVSVRSAPAYAGGRVFVGATGAGETNMVFAMDAADGDTLWFWTGAAGNAGGTMSSPVVTGQAVYIGTNWNGNANYDGCVCKFAYSYVGENGQPYQPSNPAHYGIECDVRGTPVVLGGLVYASSGRGLYGLDADNMALVIGTDHGVGVQPGGVEEIWSSFAISVRPSASPPETLLYIGEVLRPAVSLDTLLG